MRNVPVLPMTIVKFRRVSFPEPTMHAALIHLAAEFQQWNESSARADPRRHRDIAKCADRRQGRRKNDVCGRSGKLTQRSLVRRHCGVPKPMVATMELLGR